MQKKNCFRPNPNYILYPFTYLYPYPPTLRKKVRIARCTLAIVRKKSELRDANLQLREKKSFYSVEETGFHNNMTININTQLNIT